jgi:hypothetical protein
VLMRLGEVEDHRPVACLTPHVEPHNILPHPACRRLLTPLPLVVGNRRLMGVERLADAVFPGGIDQHTHRHHP